MGRDKRKRAGEERPAGTKCGEVHGAGEALVCRVLHPALAQVMLQKTQTPGKARVVTPNV